jgi:hypothetical protein
MKINPKEVKDVLQLVEILKTKKGIAGQQPWVWLATMLFAYTSKKGIAVIVKIINEKENLESENN